MGILRKIGVSAIAALSLLGVFASASDTAEARYAHRGARVNSWTGTVVVSGIAVTATRPYRGYGHGHWYWDFTPPGGPFVDYPYENCGVGPRVVSYVDRSGALVSTDRVCWY